jgi:hypothetical protein
VLQTERHSPDLAGRRSHDDLDAINTRRDALDRMAEDRGQGVELIGRHHPDAEAERQDRRRQYPHGAQAQAGHRSHAQRCSQHDVGRLGRMRPDVPDLATLRTLQAAALDLPDELGRRAGERKQVVLGHPSRVELRVAHRQPVGHDRTAPRHRLEARDTAGRVDEHVGRREQFRHLVRETENANPLVVGEALGESPSDAFVATGDADDRRVGDQRQLIDSAGEVTNPPTTA